MPANDAGTPMPPGDDFGFRWKPIWTVRHASFRCQRLIEMGNWVDAPAF
jgi:hypothetical protein